MKCDATTFHQLEQEEEEEEKERATWQPQHLLTLLAQEQPAVNGNSTITTDRRVSWSVYTPNFLLLSIDQLDAFLSIIYFLKEFSKNTNAYLLSSLVYFQMLKTPFVSASNTSELAIVRQEE